MTTYTTIYGQTLTDLAIQLYGNADAVDELLTLNDLTGKMDVPAGGDANEIDLAFPLLPATVISYEPASTLVNLQILQALADPVKGLRAVPLATAEGINPRVFDDTFADEFA